MALALGEVAALARALVRRSRADLVRSARALAPALALIVGWRLVWPALLDGGRALRARHRWAATEAAFQVGPESGTRLLLWRPTTPFSGTSPIDGAPNGLHLTTGSDGSARSRVRLGGGALFPGDYVVGLKVTDEAAAPARLSFAGSTFDLPPGAVVEVKAHIAHRGGPLEFDVTLNGPPAVSIWLAEARMTASDSTTR